MKRRHKIMIFRLFAVEATAGLLPRQQETGMLTWNVISALNATGCDKEQCILTVMENNQLDPAAPLDICGSDKTDIWNTIWRGVNNCVKENPCTGDQSIQSTRDDIVNQMCPNHSGAVATSTSITSVSATSTTPTTTSSPESAVSSIRPSETVLVTSIAKTATSPTGTPLAEKETIEVKDRSGRLSGGAIAGIIIGALAAVFLLLLAIWFIRRRHRKASSRQTSVMALEPTSAPPPEMRSAQPDWENIRSNPATPSFKALPTLTINTGGSTPPVTFASTDPEPGNFVRQDSEAALGIGINRRAETPRFSYQLSTPGINGNDQFEPVSPVSSLGDQGSMMGRKVAKTPSLVSLENFDPPFGTSVSVEHDPGNGSQGRKGASPLSVAVAAEDSGLGRMTRPDMTGTRDM